IKQLAKCCAEIASAAPNTAFYYYHIPVLTGGNFAMLDLLKEIDGEIPTFRGIKYTHEDFMDCAHHVAAVQHDGDVHRRQLGGRADAVAVLVQEDAAADAAGGTARRATQHHGLGTGLALVADAQEEGALARDREELVGRRQRVDLEGR